MYQSLVARDPTHTEARYQAAYLLVVRGNTASARPLLEQLPVSVRDTPQVLVLQVAVLADAGDAAGRDARGRHARRPA